MKHFFYLFGVLFISILLLSCHTRRYVYEPEENTTINESIDILKVHMGSGNLYVLQNWSLGEGKVTGEGVLLNPNRQIIKDHASFTIASDSIQLYEVNKTAQPSGRDITMITLSALTVAGIITCYANPHIECPSTLDFP